MKLAIFVTVIAASLGVSSAAPAIVWKNEGSSSPQHLSESIDVQSLISSTVSGDHSSALSAVVFLIGRDADGTERLSSLASSGNLPGVQGKYDTADSIHHHVNGLESSRTIARDARKSFDGTVVEVSLSEYNRKLASLAQNSNESVEKAASKAEHKRNRDISVADVLVVNVSSKDASVIDSSIVAAIESSAVRNVILSAVRSIDEVKHARKLATFDRLKVKANVPRKVAGRRRLEDEADGEQNNNNQDNNQGIYYVNMTPNIFAGILFMLLFAFVANLGFTCMGMITGQDVFVKKLPTIGREV